MSALRIVVLEWQTRPAVQLLRGSLVDESVLLANRVGGSQLQASLSGATSSLFGKSSGLGANAPALFNDVGPRRKRLLETYLSERRYILKTSEYVTFTASCKAQNEAPSNVMNQASSWLQEVGTAIVSTWNGDGPAPVKSKNFVLEAVDALRSRIEGTMRGSGWLSDESQQEEIEIAWVQNQILEMIHIMQILLIRLDSSSTKLTIPDFILPWFKLMNECGFFDSLQLVSLHTTCISKVLTNLVAISCTTGPLRLASTIAHCSCLPIYPQHSLGTRNA